jgi:hypothetical protein
MPTMTPPRAYDRGGRRLATAAVGVILTLGVACGGGAGKAVVTPVAAAEGTTTTSSADQGAAFAACLRDHGVDLPERPRPTDGTGGPPSSRPPGTGGTQSSRPPGSRPSTSLPAGVDPAKVAAAREACQSLQPARPGAEGQQSQAFQAYASCLKDHGVTFMPGTPERDDPAFKAADAICGVLRPSRPTS